MQPILLALRLMYTSFCGGLLSHMLPRQIGYHLLSGLFQRACLAFFSYGSKLRGVIGGEKFRKQNRRREERRGEEGEKVEEEGVINRA